MELIYQINGSLDPGIHVITLDEFVLEYGYNQHRSNLIIGLKMAIVDLKSVGCKTIYIDGSFVTKKTDPNDYDACWEAEGVDLLKLKNEYPLFFDFDNKRANQKAYYKGEWMPARVLAKRNPPMLYLDFFQYDKEDNIKGIICITL